MTAACPSRAPAPRHRAQAYKGSFMGEAAVCVRPICAPRDRGVRRAPRYTSAGVGRWLLPARPEILQPGVFLLSDGVTFLPRRLGFVRRSKVYPVPPTLITSQSEAAADELQARMTVSC